MPLLEVSGPGQGFKKYCDYYLHKLGIGFVILVTGNSRSKIGNGKTLTAIKLAQEIDPSFDISRLTFTPYQFLSRLEEIRDNREFYKVLILDEGEIAASSNEWYTKGSKALAAAMMTFRNTRTVIIIVTPMASLINSQVRKLCAMRVVPSLVIDQKTRRKTVHARFYSVSTDFDGEKTFYRKLVFWNTTTKRVWKPKYTTIGLPSPEIIKEYEQVDWDYKKGVNKTLLRGLKKMDDSEVDPNVTMEKLILELSAHPDVTAELEESGRVSASTIKGAKTELGIQAAGAIAKKINRNLFKLKQEASNTKVLIVKNEGASA